MGAVEESRKSGGNLQKTDSPCPGEGEWSQGNSRALAIGAASSAHRLRHLRASVGAGRDERPRLAVPETTKEIARKLNISQKTAETHRTQLMKELDIHDIAGLVRFAIRYGLISADA